MKSILRMTFLGLSMLSALGGCSKTSESKPAITQTERTIITPHMEAQIDSTNNILYCASFQMAWNKMRDQVIKEDIRLEDDPLTSRRLNRNLLSNSDISSGAYIAEAGELSQELVERINNELREKFGEQDFKLPQEKAGHRQIVAYAFLYKNLEFPTKFEKLTEPVAFAASGDLTPVKAFGVESFKYSTRLHEKISEQVTVFDYRNENDFILSLASKSADDQIIMAKITPGRTLLETYATVARRIGNAKRSYMGEEETLRIPKIDFDLTHSFRELESKRIMNNGWEGWFIARAVQDTRFKLDETGAVLKSRSFLFAMKEEAPAPGDQKPRKFIFDKPFLIYMKQKIGKYPYFVLWTNNPELMLKK
jgi:hypothetical protein